MTNCFSCEHAYNISVDGVFVDCSCDSEPCYDVWLDCLNFEKRKDIENEEVSESKSESDSVCDL